MAVQRPATRVFPALRARLGLRPRPSQAEVIALSGSSKAESGTEPRFTPTRRPRSCSSSPSIAVIGTIADQPVGGAVEEARAMSAMRKTSSASCASDASASC